MRTIYMWLIALAFLAACGGKGGESGGNAGTPDNPTNTPQTKSAVATFAMLPSNKLGLIYQKSSGESAKFNFNVDQNGNASLDVLESFASDGTIVRSYFNSNGSLRTVEVPSRGMYITVENLPGKTIYRAYNASSNFDSGFIFFVVDGKYYVGTLPSEANDAIDQLTSVVEVTNEYLSSLPVTVVSANSAFSPIGSASSSSNFASTRWTDWLIRDANAQTTDEFFASIHRDAQDIVFKNFLPISVAITTLSIAVLTKNPSAGVAAGLALYFTFQKVFADEVILGLRNGSLKPVESSQGAESLALPVSTSLPSCRSTGDHFSGVCPSKTLGKV